MAHRRARLFGLPVDLPTRLEFQMFLERALASNRAHRIVTLNPEIALEARARPRYHSVIRTADCVTVDGIGLVLALRALRRGHAERLTGTIVLEECCRLAVERDEAVAFLLRADGLTAPPVLRAALRERWPELRVAIGAVTPNAPPDPALLAALRDHAPRVLLVNFGHPNQELWIAQFLDHIPSVRVAAGIGGAIDYLTGAAKPPPLLIHRMGLEWAWRLLLQPWRWRRTCRAVLLFPLMVIVDVVRPMRGGRVLRMFLAARRGFA